MPARRRSGFVRSSRAQGGGWAGVAVNQFAVPANNKVLAATVVPNVGFSETIRRTHVSLLYSSDQNIASEASLGAVGFGVFSDTAVAVGIASLPDPVTDIDDDIWFLFQGLHTRFSFSTGGGIAEPAGSLFEIDSKAMRKLPEGKTAGLIVVNNDATFGAVCQLTVRLYSTLSKT